MQPTVSLCRPPETSSPHTFQSIDQVVDLLARPEHPHEQSQLKMCCMQFGFNLKGAIVLFSL